MMNCVQRHLVLAAILTLTPSAVAGSVAWSFNLPADFELLASGGFATGFESGSLPSTMATTAVNAATWLPDDKAWCQIGTGVYSVVPDDGLFDFELGFDPNSAMNWHDVDNALVFGFDGTGHAGPFEFSFRYYDWGESNQAIDGVWLSENGVDWYHVTGVDGIGQTGLGWSDWSDGLSQWGSLSFDLAAAATLHGLSLGGSFYVAIGEESGLPLGFFGGIHIDGVQLDLQQWMELGSALAGATGLPQLTGEGTLEGGDPVTISLTNALQDTTASLVFGIAELNVAFKSGVMVPDPLIVIPSLPTGPTGEIVISATWPAGVPAGFTSYFQYWIADAAGPNGFAASNGLSATTP